MNKDMIELYSDYLIASFGQTTATGLANLLQGSIYHDSITRFLNSETLTAKEQWQLIKPMLRQHENATPMPQAISSLMTPYSPNRTQASTTSTAGTTTTPKTKMLKALTCLTVCIIAKISTYP